VQKYHFLICQKYTSCNQQLNLLGREKAAMSNEKMMRGLDMSGTENGNNGSACICMGKIRLGAKAVLVASDSRNVHEWIYRYLEPYEAKGYAFYRIENQARFFEYAGKADTVMAFIEDGFFGERAVGKLDYIRRQYPKLGLVLFSASYVPPDAAARYLCWSSGSYLSLRDGEGEIRESLEAVFDRRQSVPSYLRGRIEEYAHLTGIEPYLTKREIEIVRYAAEGKTAKETAAALMVSYRTVTSHLCNIYQKFGVRNVVGVLRLAVSKGILPMEEIMAYAAQS
jgi:DNA-binding CsgD family transcriptional regulator